MSSRRITALTNIFFDDEYENEEGCSNYAAARGAVDYARQKKKQNQKRSIKKKYAAQLRQQKAVAAQRTAASQTKGLAVLRQKGKRSLILALAVLLLAGFCLNCVNGCTMLLQGGLSALGGSTYPSQDEDMLRAEAAYAESERELQNYLDNYERTHSYDEYHFMLDEIGHDPYVLISLLTAYQGGSWRFAEVEELIKDLFDRQYLLVESVEMEIRTDAEGNNYPWYVCYVELRNRDLAQQTAILPTDRLELCALYMRTLGNRPDLFDRAEYPNASVIEPPLIYDIPPEALSDAVFAAMIAEAEKYLGYPYVWGVSNPSTSFDCSGFVCWVVNHTEGLANVGRTTANRLAQPDNGCFSGQRQVGGFGFFQGYLCQCAERSQPRRHLCRRQNDDTLRLANCVPFPKKWTEKRVKNGIKINQRCQK